MNRTHTLIALLLATLPSAQLAQAAGARPVVTAYVFPQNGVMQAEAVDPHRVDRINYAFANIENGKLVAGSANDSENLSQLVALKKANPALAVLISVGGWLWSGNFSDAALTAQSRHVFIDSAMDFIKAHDLDGLDVDWEYPGQAGSTNHFRAEDKRNFTLLLKGLRERFDRESKNTHRHLYLTIAAGSDESFLDHTEMKKVQGYLDAVNLMCYDYYEPGSDPITGNHAPLFTDPDDPKKASADASVKAYEAAGVPSAKIFLGVPFYGHMWGQVADVHHGLFQTGKPIPNGYAPYSAIAGTMLDHGYTRYWDVAANVPYLYNADKQIFVSYEDPESLALKCKYVETHKLGGIMFWSYFNDAQGTLLKVIDQGLQADAGPGAGQTAATPAQ